MARILVVDDEAQIRDVLCRMMEHCGYSVDQAIHGQDAIQKLGESTYDLVISDILMPERDGLEVIMFLKREQPDVKVIAISAPGNELYLNTARGLGAVRVFSKPFRLKDLAGAVKELIPTRPDLPSDRPVL